MCLAEIVHDFALYRLPINIVRSQEMERADLSTNYERVKLGGGEE